MTRWARSQGAQYQILNHQPEPGAVAVYTASLPYIGWTFHTGLYANSSPTEIWKFAPSFAPPSASLQRAEGSPSTHP